MTQSRIDPTFFFNSHCLSAVEVADTLSSATSRQLLATSLREDGVIVTIDHEPAVFCGLQVYRDQEGIALFAKKEIEELINKFDVDCTNKNTICGEEEIAEREYRSKRRKDFFLPISSGIIDLDLHGKTGYLILNN